MSDDESIEAVEQSSLFVVHSSFRSSICSYLTLQAVQPCGLCSRSYQTHAPTDSHYCGVIMSTIASQITSLTIVYSTVYSGTGQRKYQSSASLAFVRGIHRGPVNSPHKRPVTWKMSPFDDLNLNLKVDHNSRHKRIIHGPKTPQGETVAKPGTLLLMILNIIFKCDREEVRGNLSNPGFFPQR